MYQSIKEKAMKAGVAVGALALAGQASAAGITVDTADVVASLTNGVTTVSAICVAALSIVVVVKIFKYVRTAF